MQTNDQTIAQATDSTMRNAVSPETAATAAPQPEAAEDRKRNSNHNATTAHSAGKGGPFRKRKPGKALPAPAHSHFLLIRLAPAHTGMFRFLLEAYDNLAYFTVLEKDTALLRLIYSPHCEKSVRRALADIAQTIAMTVEEWPFPQGEDAAVQAGGDIKDAQRAAAHED